MAIKRWIGGATARVDLWTITVAGTWASADTVTVSLGNKNLVITLGGSASTATADIAAEICNAFNAADNSSPGTGFTWSNGGQEFLEFQDLTATVLGSVVTLTGATAGLPHDLVVTEATAGDGTATEANPAGTKATGPNHLDNPDNYADGVLPVDNDVLWFDTGAVSVLYGLTYFRANNIDLDVYITNDWTGQLGLDAVRTTPAAYTEYRQQWFQARGGGKVLKVLPGVTSATNQGFLKIDLQDQSTLSVSITARRGNTGAVPNVFIAGATNGVNNNSVYIQAGAVSIEPDDAPTDATKYFSPGGLYFGTPGAAPTDCVVYIGKNAKVYKAGGLFLYGGTVYCDSWTLDGSDECPVQLDGGVYWARGAGSEHIFTVERGATLFPQNPTENALTFAQIFNRGTLDNRQGPGKSCADVKLYAKSSFYDPVATDTGAAWFLPSFVGCQPSDLTACVFPANRTMNYSTAATPD